MFPPYGGLGRASHVTRQYFDSSGEVYSRVRMTVNKNIFPINSAREVHRLLSSVTFMLSLALGWYSGTAIHFCDARPNSEIAQSKTNELD